MHEKIILLQEWKCGDKYLGVSVAVSDRFAPNPYRGVEIILHQSWLLGKLLGRKKTLKVDLSWVRQVIYSERALTPRWLAIVTRPVRLFVPLSPFSTSYHVTLKGLLTRRRSSCAART